MPRNPLVSSSQSMPQQQLGDSKSSVSIGAPHVHTENLQHHQNQNLDKETTSRIKQLRPQAFAREKIALTGLSKSLPDSDFNDRLGDSSSRNSSQQYSSHNSDDNSGLLKPINSSSDGSVPPDMASRLNSPEVAPLKQSGSARLRQPAMEVFPMGPSRSLEGIHALRAAVGIRIAHELDNCQNLNIFSDCVCRRRWTHFEWPVQRLKNH